MEFNQALDNWLNEANKIASEPLTINSGKKYIRIVADGGSAFCFIDKETGDILKAASWKAPAKHARGNIFTKNTGINAYGAKYMYR